MRCNRHRCRSNSSREERLTRLLQWLLLCLWLLLLLIAVIINAIRLFVVEAVLLLLACIGWGSPTHRRHLVLSLALHGCWHGGRHRLGCRHRVVVVAGTIVVSLVSISMSVVVGVIVVLLLLLIGWIENRRTRILLDIIRVCAHLVVVLSKVVVLVVLMVATHIRVGLLLLALVVVGVVLVFGLVLERCLATALTTWIASILLLIVVVLLICALLCRRRRTIVSVVRVRVVLWVRVVWLALRVVVPTIVILLLRFVAVTSV